MTDSGDLRVVMGVPVRRPEHSGAEGVPVRRPEHSGAETGTQQSGGRPEHSGAEGDRSSAPARRRSGVPAGPPRRRADRRSPVTDSGDLRVVMGVPVRRPEHSGVMGVPVGRPEHSGVPVRRPEHSRAEGDRNTAERRPGLSRRTHPASSARASRLPGSARTPPARLRSAGRSQLAPSASRLRRCCRRCGRGGGHRR